MNLRVAWRLPALVSLSSIAAAAPQAQQRGSLMTIGRDGTLSAPMQIILLLTALTLLPAVLVSLTPFLRLTVVLHFLRQALGTQTAPSNQVLLGLSLFLSILIMQPVLTDVYSKAWVPLEKGQMTTAQAL